MSNKTKLYAQCLCNKPHQLEYTFRMGVGKLINDELLRATGEICGQTREAILTELAREFEKEAVYVDASGFEMTICDEYMNTRIHGWSVDDDGIHIDLHQDEVFEATRIAERIEARIRDLARPYNNEALTQLYNELAW